MMEKKYYQLTQNQEKYVRIKSGLDRMLAKIGLVVLSPVFGGIVLAIKLEEGLRAPVFFSQDRVGINQKIFKLYKFRSMRLDTPHDMPTHLLENPDQYITKVGRFLRKTSLDELPQLINISKGDMHVVGSRPALYNQADLIDIREEYGVHQLKPGLTGWAQIHGRDELEIEEKAKLDAYYLQHVSLWLDIKCIFGTIWSVLRSDGVVEGGTGEMKRKKKLLFVTNHSYMFWQFRRELVEELQKDYEVVISTPYVGHEEDFQNMGCKMIETPVDRRGINPRTDLKLYRTYRELLKKEKPNLVVTYSIKPNIYAGIACQLQKIPYYVNVQGLGTAFQKPILSEIVTGMYRIACRKAQTVFFENEANAKIFREKKITPEKQQMILPGAGINLEHYAYCPYPKHEKVHFLYLGRIMKEKGMDELFEAIQRLYEEFNGQVVLNLVGFFEDEYKAQVEQLVKAGIAVFHGFQEDPRPYYGEADCVVLPSYHEGMSNVLLEAAASGRVLVTSNIPGCREAVDNGKNGLLCKVKDSDSLYQAMKKVVELTPEKRELAGKLGREKMEREFAKEKVVQMTAEKIKEM